MLALLRRSLQLRDRYEQGAISEHGLHRARGRVMAKLNRLLEVQYRNPANRRLARHLDHELPWIFAFLYCPGLDATNNAAERAIRGMVIARKVWGGIGPGRSARASCSWSACCALLQRAASFRDRGHRPGRGSPRAELCLRGRTAPFATPCPTP